MGDGALDGGARRCVVSWYRGSIMVSQYHSSITVVPYHHLSSQPISNPHRILTLITRSYTWIRILTLPLKRDSYSDAGSLGKKFSRLVDEMIFFPFPI